MRSRPSPPSATGGSLATCPPRTSSGSESSSRPLACPTSPKRAFGARGSRVACSRGKAEMTQDKNTRVVETDVAIIGGGPAGSTTATLLAKAGLRVELFERDRFPRYHIGESLIPETYWVLERLDMLDKMKRSHFVKKHSVQFVNAMGKESAPFYFWDNKPHECSQTWQVVRSEFDKMMLDNAREHGVNAYEGARVMDVLFEDDRAVGVKVRTSEGEYDVRSKVVEIGRASCRERV